VLLIEGTLTLSQSPTNFTGLALRLTFTDRS
jgi:hypothetical protein